MAVTRRELERILLAHPARHKPWYPFTPEEDRELSLAEKMQNPWWFIPLLRIISTDGQIFDLVDMYEEQAQFLRALLRWKQVIVIKPRQVGLSTMSTAFLFWYLYTATDQLGALSLCHDEDAQHRMNSFLRGYGDSLPSSFRPRWKPDNAELLGMAHNQCMFAQKVAGGRGQGRSFTFQLLHATEMGFWPGGSAAASSHTADEQVWASVLATLHSGPHRHVIVESTGNGPGGLFYDLSKKKRKDPSWGFLFFQWWKYNRYELALKNCAFEINLDKPLDDYESRDIDAMIEAGLDEQKILRKVAWRRTKVDDTNLHQFLTEYPGSWEDPFVVTGRAWFDGMLLSRLLAQLPPPEHVPDDELVIFEEPEEDMDYCIGVDSCGGTGGDYAYHCVINKHNEQVARWRSNSKKPHEQAHALWRTARKYNNALCGIELNGKHGKRVLDRAMQLGIRVWYRDARHAGFLSQRGQAGQSKDMMYDWCAELMSYVAVDPHSPMGGMCTVRDPVVVSEAIALRENDVGNLEAPPGEHDDGIDALAIAFWINKPENEVRPMTKPPRELRSPGLYIKGRRIR